MVAGLLMNQEWEYVYFSLVKQKWLRNVNINTSNRSMIILIPDLWCFICPWTEVTGRTNTPKRCSCLWLQMNPTLFQESCEFPVFACVLTQHTDLLRYLKESSQRRTLNQDFWQQRVLLPHLEDQRTWDRRLLSSVFVDVPPHLPANQDENKVPTVQAWDEMSFPWSRTGSRDVAGMLLEVDTGRWGEKTGVFIFRRPAPPV